MTNYGKYELLSLRNNSIIIKEIFKISINTIIFHRTFEKFEYKEVESILPYITYIKIINQNFDLKIQKALNDIDTYLVKFGKCKVIVEFYKNIGKKYFLLRNFENLFESWDFYFEKEGNSNEVSNDIEFVVRDYISRILIFINDRFDFLPHIQFDELSIINEDMFPFKISVSQN